EVGSEDGNVNVNCGGVSNGVYACPAGTDYQMYYPFSVPSQIAGHPVYVDEITIYYGIKDADVATSNTADYIDIVYVSYADNANGQVYVVSHTANMGDDTYNADQNHNIVDTSFEMVDRTYWLRFVTVQDSSRADIRIYNIQVKYHVKVHG
ncbi:MAG: hypothetical protein ABGF52_13630, partial [Candidatus Asgardarchaeum sp.]